MTRRAAANLVRLEYGALFDLHSQHTPICRF
jgi:hypothetical protein